MAGFQGRDATSQAVRHRLPAVEELPGHPVVGQLAIQDEHCAQSGFGEQRYIDPPPVPQQVEIRFDRFLVLAELGDEVRF